MLIEYKGRTPTIHPNAYVAPNAVIRGDVTIGEGSSILFGAVVTDEGGPVRVGSHCVIMEQAVVRGTPQHPVELGDSVLVGPHAHLSGCTVGEGVFLATGVTIFNGVRIGKGAEVRINGIVHVNSVLEAGTTVPIGWIAVGDPAEIFSPDRHDEIWKIQKEMNFPGTVWGVDRSVSQAERIRRYAEALQRHRRDRPLSSD